MKLLKVTFLFTLCLSISLILGSLRSKTTRENQWNIHTKKFPGQGGSNACQTFAFLRAMQICVNFSDQSEKVSFDAHSYFQKISKEKEITHPNECHLSTELISKPIEDMNSDRKFKLIDTPNHLGQYAKPCNGRRGFGINTKKLGQDRELEMINYIDNKIKEGPIVAGCNGSLFDHIVKQRLAERQNKTNIDNDNQLIKSCEENGSAISHSILIAGKFEKQVPSSSFKRSLFTIVDSAGDPNANFGNSDSFITYLTRDEIQACFNLFALSIDCKNIQEVKDSKK